MRRRGLLHAGAAAGLVMLLGGHTPYGQWVVYRKKHLLIGCHRDDPAAYALAKRLEALLAEHLPEARARTARAPHAGRLASLLATGQLDVAILDPAEAGDMIDGRDGFAAYGPVPIRLLLPLGQHLLVARHDFLTKHARLLTAALAEMAPPVAPAQMDDPPIPWHPGSLAAVRQGE